MHAKEVHFFPVKSGVNQDKNPKLALNELSILVRQIGARIVGFMVKAPNFAQS